MITRSFRFTLFFYILPLSLCLLLYLYSMQGSRSLFQTGIKLQGQPGQTGIAKSRPFLNIWRDKKQQRHFSKSTQSETRSSLDSSDKMADVAAPAAPAAPAPADGPKTFFDFKTKDGYDLSQHRNKVVLVVNTASECGFTKQYGPLQTLWEDLSKQYPTDFHLLAFPCNQFGGQEPGSNEEIQNFCTGKFKTTFEILGKTDVNGENVEPVWEWMKNEKSGLMGLKMIKWNFEKFLIGRDGRVKGRWASTTDPSGLRKKIVEEIEKKQ